MCFQNFKTDSYWVRGGHRSATTKNFGDIIFKALFGFCSMCKGKKLMTLSDNSIQTEGLASFLQTFGKKFC